MVGGAYALRAHTGIWRDTKGLDLFVRKVQIHEPLKTLGEFTVPIKLHKDVTAHLRVLIEKEAAE